MKKKRRLIVLLGIIIVLCIIAGYCDYKYYTYKADETINEYVEEIDLGDVKGVCGKRRVASAISSCKNVTCSSKKNSGACNASKCCQWAACNISNCASATVNKSGQCVCNTCDKYYQKVDGGRRCLPKTSSTCCARTSSGSYVTLTDSTACSLAINSGKHVHSGSCNLCSNSTISIPVKASQNTGITITASKPEQGLTCTWSVKAGGKSASLSCGGNKSCSVNIGGFAACTSVSVNVSGPTSASGKVTIETKFTEDEENRNFKSTDKIPATAADADLKGKSYYGSEDNCVTKADGTRDCQVHVRSNCDHRYNYCCVDNGTLLTSSKAIYKANQPTKVCPTNYALLENVKKEDCVIENDLGGCNISNIPSPKQTGEANSCESAVSIKVDEGKQCTNTTENVTTSFYEISCAKTVKTRFDYGNDGKTDTIRTLYRGEGFAFGINVETSVNCKYTFYDTVWNNAYNKVIDKIRKIDSNLVKYVEGNKQEEWKTYINNNILNRNGINSASTLYDLWDIIENLREAVKTYNAYEPSKNYKENGEIILKVNEKGKKVETKHKLVSIVTEEGTYKTSNISVKNLNKPLVSNPKSYSLSSSVPRKVLLIPKKVCIDKGTGKFNTIEGMECPKNTIDGGNKIYTNMGTDVTKEKEAYQISIKVEGLGSNDSSVTNDKCNLKIIESKYIYRPIDVTNPFISSNWQKGKNWVNDTFDFTRVINKDTWKDNSKRKVIALTTKDILAIKESNAKAWKDTNSPYLGLCESQKETLQDEITKKICSLIK